MASQSRSSTDPLGDFIDQKLAEQRSRDLAQYLQMPPVNYGLGDSTREARGALSRMAWPAPSASQYSSSPNSNANDVNGLDLPNSYVLQTPGGADTEAKGEKILRDMRDADRARQAAAAQNATRSAADLAAHAQMATDSLRGSSRKAAYLHAQRSMGSAGSGAAGLSGLGDGMDLLSPEFGGHSGQTLEGASIGKINRNLGAGKQAILDGIVDRGDGALAYVAAELFVPGNVVEGIAGVAAPALGKVFGAGVTLLNKVPVLGADLGVAASRLADSATAWGSNILDNFAVPRMNSPQLGGVLVDPVASGARGIGSTGDVAAAVTRMDLSAQFSVSKTPQGVKLQYGDPNGWSAVGGDSHGIVGFVDRNGILGVDVYASPELRAQYGSGQDMYSSLMTRLLQENVEISGIRGAWLKGTDSVNYAQYQGGLSAGLDPAQSALNTWTGKLAQSYGYSHVESITGSSSNVYVLFRKSGSGR